jgi:hypothetical protein
MRRAWETCELAALGDTALFAHKHLLRVLVARLNAVEPSKLCETYS